MLCSLVAWCYALKKLDISLFNTDKRIDISGMFLNAQLKLITKIKSLNENINEEAFKDDDGLILLI